ncbi:neuroepithelial cell-transforming gene 1 protein-like isoform X2 [Rhinolophus ferrumequinum]|uniref:neuroepithelial cell-transforming gene 1 protein-like isoform X2 n=1 Tax=Rhinolophus ferrumequinum TaxID=59479 RepID=UPI00140F6920|nr:neuroepithelial cell-transforming gene 1 protein-like isoform X2 [Rhinolophus ferrumequinum]
MVADSLAIASFEYSLWRDSSFTFLTPGPHWDFTLKRKRRAKDDDVVRLSSLDLKTGASQAYFPHSLKQLRRYQHWRARLFYQACFDQQTLQQ